MPKDIRKVIEFVCAGNFTRSTTAEAVASQELIRRGLNATYRIISSGVDVDKPWDERVASIDYDIKRLLIRAGIEQRIFPDGEADQVRANLALDNGSISAQHLSRVMDVFSARERDWKQNLLLRLGIKGLKTTQDQTVPRDDVIAVFAMDRETYDAARQLYGKMANLPMIGVLSAFARGIPGAEIPTIAVSGLDQFWYMDSIRQLKSDVPIALGKLFERLRGEQYG